MKTSTVVVFLCLIAMVVAAQKSSPAKQSRPGKQSSIGTPYPEQENRSSRTKRGLLLLKKKLLLGALGVTAAKIGAVGAAGVAGALALKAKSAHKAVAHTTYFHHGRNYRNESEIESERW